MRRLADIFILSDMPSAIRIVLVNTTHPGNIGATARAIKNMGFARLYLVSPKSFPDQEAVARASGADDILQNATVTDSLEAALAGCHLVMGVSARQRALSWPVITPRQCAEQAAGVHAEHEVAIVFGREHAGLSNDELAMCHYQVRIPCNADFPSLNLAAAVQIIAYECHLAACREEEVLPEQIDEPAAAEEIELFYRHLEQVLIEIDFLNPAQPRQLMRRLRRLFSRSRPDQNELNILRGILTAVHKYRNTSTPSAGH